MPLTPKQLSSLSNADLKAYAAKDYRKMSNAGLKVINVSASPSAPSDNDSFLGNLAKNIPGGTKIGVSDLANNLTQDIVHYSPLRLIPAFQKLANESQLADQQVEKNNPEIGKGAGAAIGYYGAQGVPYMATAAVPGVGEESIENALGRYGLKSTEGLGKALSVGLKSLENAAQGAALNYYHPEQGALIAGSVLPAGMLVGKALAGLIKGGKAGAEFISRMGGNKKQIAKPDRDWETR